MLFKRIFLVLLTTLLIVDSNSCKNIYHRVYAGNQSQLLRSCFSEDFALNKTTLILYNSKWSYMSKTPSMCGNTRNMFDQHLVFYWHSRVNIELAHININRILSLRK